MIVVISGMTRSQHYLKHEAWTPCTAQFHGSIAWVRICEAKPDKAVPKHVSLIAQHWQVPAKWRMLRCVMFGYRQLAEIIKFTPGKTKLSQQTMLTMTRFLKALIFLLYLEIDSVDISLDA